MVFNSREKVKYYLTVLGDILLKKPNLLYFINPKSKQWVKEWQEKRQEIAKQYDEQLLAIQKEFNAKEAEVRNQNLLTTEAGIKDALDKGIINEKQYAEFKTAVAYEKSKEIGEKFMANILERCGRRACAKSTKCVESQVCPRYCATSEEG